MNELTPSESVRIPICITVKTETVQLLIEMAKDMGITLDDVLSFLAEDAVIDLERPNLNFEGITIPDKCSKKDLLRALE